jgi:hypothetical protein
MVSTKTIPGQIKKSFLENLTRLKDASSIMNKEHTTKMLSSIDILSDSTEGLGFLYEHIGQVDAAGFFTNTMWEDPARLVPSLVEGTIGSGGYNTMYELMSELRMLAIAKGNLPGNKFGRARARAFIEDVMVNNIDHLFPDASDEKRMADASIRNKVHVLFSFLLDHIALDGIKERLATEIELICLQRPVVTDRVLEIIRTMKEKMTLDAASETDRRLQHYVYSVYYPSVKARELEPGEYRDFLEKADKPQLIRECEELGFTLRDTGLSSPYHAILLRRLAGEPALLKKALVLDSTGRAELDKHEEFVGSLITQTIHEDTARSCYGLARVLERGLLSRQPVLSGLQRILAITLHPDIAAAIRKSRPGSVLDEKSILLAECLGILGQPIGVGQGWNPTCQSARGISLWSSYAPGKLLGLVETAAKTNNLTFRFEGHLIRSDELAPGLAAVLDYNLDAVSIVLVPHLDKIYSEMMRRASLRGEDPHKWVNPGMYGQWIPTGFISAYNDLTNTISDYETFLRTFYATHHPDYNGGQNLAYPNPVGIFLTSSTGKLIGFHAVSILRVRKNKGVTRVYMLNPNNEGRQRWQENMSPTVAGNGEIAGESSLPFHQFASRLYAFHFNPSDVSEPGSLEKVDADEIKKVYEIARKTWGESYVWTGEAPGVHS